MVAQPWVGLELVDFPGDSVETVVEQLEVDLGWAVQPVVVLDLAVSFVAVPEWAEPSVVDLEWAVPSVVVLDLAVSSVADPEWADPSGVGLEWADHFEGVAGTVVDLEWVAQLVDVAGTGVGLPEDTDFPVQDMPDQNIAEGVLELDIVEGDLRT